jgi:hypothetical protein
MKKGQGWARRVTKENLSSFAAYLRQTDYASEARLHAAADEQAKMEEASAPSPFKGTALNFPNRFHLTKVKKASSARRTSSTPAAIAVSKGQVQALGPKGGLVWRKRLNRSDVQRSSGSTNPTGCLRFTQARKYNEQAVDQTSFFRQDTFGNFQWSILKRSPYEEATNIAFHVTINGKAFGEVELQVRHKPSGEAHQGNYTTSLHWGKLIKTIKTEAAPGQMLSLYAPRTGSNSPFFIEIS